MSVFGIKKHSRHSDVLAVMVFISALLLPVESVYSANPYEVVSSYFAEINEFMKETAEEVAPVGNLAATEKLLKGKISDQPAFEVLLRTNSKGVVISEVTEDGIQPRNFRKVGTR